MPMCGRGHRATPTTAPDRVLAATEFSVGDERVERRTSSAYEVTRSGLDPRNEDRTIHREEPSEPTRSCLSTSVSVFGGPTTPGASDQGSLTVPGAIVRTGPDTSDHTTTTP